MFAMKLIRVPVHHIKTKFQREISETCIQGKNGANRIVKLKHVTVRQLKFCLLTCLSQLLLVTQTVNQTSGQSFTISSACMAPECKIQKTEILTKTADTATRILFRSKQQSRERVSRNFLSLWKMIVKVYRSLVES